MTTHVLFVFAGWSMAPGGDTRRRVRTALEFLRQEPLHRGRWYVVCLGGRFNAATATRSAAELMCDWIRSENLLPSRQIFAETHSRDTFENLSEGFALLEREQISLRGAELLLVTHPWHAERIQVILRRVYHRSARVIPAWHYLTWTQRLNELFLQAYLPFDPQGAGWIPRWIRSRRTINNAKSVKCRQQKRSSLSSHVTSKRYVK